MQAKRVLFVACLTTLLLGAAAFGEGLKLSGTSTKSSAVLLQNKMQVLDGRAAEQYGFSSRLRPGAAAAAAEDRYSGTIPSYRGKYKGQYLSAAKAAAARHGIPEDLFLRLVQQESGWNPQAKSHAGALGLAQLMPGTAATLGVNPRDPYENLDGGARYLRMMYNRFRSWRLALAAYNAGPEAVEKHGGIPPYRETKSYVRAILGS